MSVTLDTSHSPIGPCGQSEQSPFEDSWRYVATAFVSCFWDRGENTEVAIVHSIVDINPGEPVHISRLLAFELTKHPRKVSV